MAKADGKLNLEFTLEQARNLAASLRMHGKSIEEEEEEGTSWALNRKL